MPAYRTPCREGCRQFLGYGEDDGRVVSFAKAPFEEEHHNMKHAKEGERWVYSCCILFDGDVGQCMDVFLRWNGWYQHVRKFHPELLSVVAGKNRLDGEEHRKKYRWYFNQDNEKFAVQKQVFVFKGGWDNLLAGSRSHKRTAEVPEAKPSQEAMSSEDFKALVVSLSEKITKLEEKSKKQ